MPVFFFNFCERPSVLPAVSTLTDYTLTGPTLTASKQREREMVSEGETREKRHQLVEWELAAERTDGETERQNVWKRAQGVGKNCDGGIRKSFKSEPERGG